jgi:hypothetical protein
MSRRKEFMAHLRQTDRQNLEPISDLQWRRYKARVKKPDVAPSDQKNWHRWHAREKIQRAISQREGVPLDQLRQIWHDRSLAKKEENPHYFHLLKRAHPGGKDYYDELVTDMTGLSPRTYTHNHPLIPGVFRGLRFADPNQIRVERQKWKALTLRHLGAAAGLVQWDLAKRKWPKSEDERLAQEGIERINHIRGDPFSYRKPNGELRNFGLKHIDPYKYNSARASEATGIPRDSRAFN